MASEYEEPDFTEEELARLAAANPVDPDLGPSEEELTDELLARRRAAAEEQLDLLTELESQRELKEAMRQEEELEAELEAEQEEAMFGESFIGDDPEGYLDPEEDEYGDEGEEEDVDVDVPSGLSSTLQNMLIGDNPAPQRQLTRARPLDQRAWFTRANAAALEALPPGDSQACLHEGVRMLALPGVEAFYVYPNTLGNIETSRPYGLMPKLSGYSAVVADDCPALVLLALARFELSHRLLVPIEAPSDAQLQPYDTPAGRKWPLAEAFREWVLPPNPDAARMRSEQARAIEAVRQLRHNTALEMPEFENEALTFAHIVNSPVHVDIVSRDRLVRGSTATSSEFFMYIELPDIKGVMNLASASAAGKVLTVGDLRRLRSPFSTRTEIYDEAQLVARGMGLRCKSTTSELVRWDSNCTIAFEDQFTVVRNHVVQWSANEPAHFFSITTPGGCVRNLVAITASEPPTRDDYQQLPVGLQRCLASIPFSRGSAVQEVTVTGVEGLTDLYVMTRIRDVTRHLLAPYFPEDDDTGAAARYLHGHVMRRTTRDDFRIHVSISPGRPSIEVTVEEAELLVPRGYIPFNNRDFTALVLRELAEMLPADNITPTQKQQRIAEIFGIDSKEMSSPYYKVSAVSASPARRAYPLLLE